MSSPTIVKVELGKRSYSISVESGLTSSLAKLIEQDVSNLGLKRDHAVVVSDANVSALYSESVVAEIGSVFKKVTSVNFPPGEATKSIQWLDTLWQQLLQFQTNRSSVLFALGGGVVGDLAGFAAATYGRGIPFMQIPTSLLAQVDSSVGGKVGINLPGAKNMVGSFWQPASVYIDPDMLKTLSDRDFRCGLAEVVKYGVIMDTDLFQYLEESADKILARDSHVLTNIIATCCRLKAEVVAADETETSGRRAILNYGHTFGHAIENVAGYGEFSHGEAISIGMDCAARTAMALGRVDEMFVQRQSNLLTRFGLPVRLDDPTDEFVDQLVVAMQFDKKSEAGQLRLILPSELGGVELVDSPPDELLRQSFFTSPNELERRD